jgi:Tetratricopeptide repeat.
LLDFQQSTRLGDGGEGLLNIGYVAATEGRYEEALTAFRGARQRGMDSPGLAFNEAKVLEKIGQPELALRVYRAATQKQGDPAIIPLAHAARASLLIRLRRLQEAEEDLAKALALAPEEAETLRALALSAMFRDQWGEAIQLYDRLIQRQQAIAEDWANRARAKFASGLRAEALEDLKQARQLDPHDGNWSRLEQMMRGESIAPSEAAQAAPRRKL